MRKLKILLIGLSISLFVVGCGNNTDLVKDGLMNFNKTITVGDAFDNWNDCKDSEWESFETDNGTPVVQFTCEKKNAKEYFQKVKSFQYKSLLAWPTKKQDKASYLDIKSAKQIFQWTINKDDTFQIDNVQIEIVWEDGKKFSDSQNSMEQVEDAYDNEITFNLSEINELTAFQETNTWYMIRTRAKLNY